MKRIKKSVFIPALLLVYLAVMAYMGREKLFAGSYLEYFGILVVTLVCILILFFTLRKQEEVRERRRREAEERENTPKNSSDESAPDNK
jgi:cbb3-type cytochrome oxidase subunit 3